MRSGGTCVRSALRRVLSGDLDRIVLMAMRKEPDLRYATVEQFGQDIDRCLSGLPVVASRRTWTYLTRKFLRRHRFGVAASVVILLLLLAGLAGTAWQAHIARQQQTIAEQRFRDVRALAHSFLFEFHDSIKDLPGATPTRHLIVERALQYLTRLSTQAGNDRSLQHELVVAYQRIGDIQGNPYFANLGDANGALSSYRQALALCEQLLRTDSHDPIARGALALSHRRVADMLAATGAMSAALESYETARRQYDALLVDYPHDRTLIRERAANETVRAALLVYNGDAIPGLELLKQTLPVLQSLVVDSDMDAPAWRDLEICHQKLGQALAATGDTEGALDHYDQALQIALKGSRQNPASARAARCRLQLCPIGWTTGDYRASR